MQKKRKKAGFRTSEDQAIGPAYTLSELLDMALCQSQTEFTYLYIEVLRFFHNAIGCPQGPFVPRGGLLSRSSVPKFVRGNKLGDGVGDTMSASHCQAPPRPRSPHGRNIGPTDTASGAACATKGAPLSSRSSILDWASSRSPTPSASRDGCAVDERRVRRRRTALPRTPCLRTL